MPDLKRLFSTQGMVFVAVMVAIMALSACSGQPAVDSTAPTQPAGSTDPTQTAGTSAPVSFSKDVLPILNSRCLECHGGRKIEEGFNITTYEHIMAGSRKGPAVVPGDPAHSAMIQLIQQGKMPKRGPKLLPDQLQTLISWIQAGALNN